MRQRFPTNPLPSIELFVSTFRRICFCIISMLVLPGKMLVIHRIFPLPAPIEAILCKNIIADIARADHMRITAGSHSPDSRW